MNIRRLFATLPVLAGLLSLAGPALADKIGPPQPYETFSPDRRFAFSILNLERHARGPLDAGLNKSVDVLDVHPTEQRDRRARNAARLVAPDRLETHLRVES